MDEIHVWFACGHVATAPEAPADGLACPTCGETRVQRVEAPAPRFRAVNCGQAQMGPLVTHDGAN